MNSASLIHHADSARVASDGPTPREPSTRVAPGNNAGGFIFVLTHKLIEERSVLVAAQNGAVSGLAESPVHGTHQRILTAQDAAIREDGIPIKPYFVANLADSL